MLKNIQNSLLVMAFVPMLAMPTIGLNIVSLNSASTNKIADTQENTQTAAYLRKIKAEKIDKYFKDRSMPLFGLGMDFVLAAEKYGLPVNFLPAIAIRESSGGKAACYNNPFGWGSCKIKFASFSESIEVVAKNLGGANPNTAYYYSNNSIKNKLYYYNGTIITGYEDQVLAIMDKITYSN